MKPEPFDRIRFLEFLEKECGIIPGDSILVGVSGGADSLYLLWHLQENGFRTTAATFNHQLRPSAADEVEFVRRICIEWSVPYLSGTQDVLSYARKQKLSTEEAARECRYRFLFDAAEKIGAAAVATGHHADDQAETVLMHFLRGSGPDGLAGMRPRTFFPQWSKTIPLVRPILPISRMEIESWCREKGLQPVNDESNMDNHYFRNRLRNRLIPLLEAEYNPQVRKNINKTARVIQTDLDWIDDLINQSWEKVVLPDLSNESRVVLNRNLFLESHPAEQARILRKAAFGLRPDARDFGFDAIESGLTFFRNAKRVDQISFPEKLKLLRENELLIVACEDAPLNFDKYPQLENENVAIYLQEGQPVQIGPWVFNAERKIIQPGTFSDLLRLSKEDPFCCLMDYEKISPPITIRCAKKGERFAPIGMNGKSQKLSDFWINRKLPRQLRSLYPVIADRERILWIPGFQSAEAGKITPETVEVLYIQAVLTE
ncbi:MAG TPA: tRNA lysidine(34) synthetase TilS [Flexilinea sp.]|nr:tRNA lysidine(34) synthetase TilS [Flexilinea sp.]